MIPTQRLPGSLTPLNTALAALTERLVPVAPVELPLMEALGCVAAEMSPLNVYPPHDVAASDGWALCARDLVGASSYSPLSLAGSPAWVEAGDALPRGCDCVIDSDLVEVAGAVFEVSAEAIPGQGVRRAGGDIAEGSSPIAAGLPIRQRHLLLARASGLEKINVRRPRLRLINIPAVSRLTATAQLIAESARKAGAEIVVAEAAARDAVSIATALDTGACDLLLIIGGSGIGRSDATVIALADRGEVIAHGIALEPGRTSAVGRIERIPVVALPGAPDQALAAWWTLVLPVLDCLTGRQPRETIALPLARKVSSSVGIAEVVLLERCADGWMPSAVGDPSLTAIAHADAWLAVAAEAEGFAAGTSVDAYMLSD